jgi:polysaccharide deacetylase 2 family uncharacterized protein YibQ
MVALLLASIYFPMRDLANRQDAAERQAERAVEPAPSQPDSRPLLADPPPPAPAADVADAPPPEPEAPAAAAREPVIAQRTEDAPVAPAEPMRPQAPALPDTAQAAPDAAPPAAPTVTPETAPAPAEPDLAQAAPEPTPALPQPQAAPPVPGLANRPSAISPAPAADPAPIAEAAPQPTALPAPDAAEDVAWPDPVPATAAPSGQALAVAAARAPVPAELPALPGGPIPPGAPGAAPLPDLAAIPVPGLPQETPVPDTEAARSEPAPAPAGFSAFRAPDARTAPEQPGVKLAALTQPIVDAPAEPRAEIAEPTPQAQPVPGPAPETQRLPQAGLPEPEPVPDPGADTPADSPASERFAGLQTAPRPAPSGTLPRRLVVGGAEDGVSRLTARRIGTGTGTRLPQIGVTDDPAPETPAALLPEGAEAPPVGALARNAQPWEGTGPRTAIVLQATSPDRAITDILSGIDAPLAVALDPAWLEAPQRAQALRAAGHEVLILLTGLPPNPQPRDIDVALNSHIARLPEAVGVLLQSDSPVAASPALLSQLAARLAQTGHGLIAQPVGLNTVSRVARSEGMALAPVDMLLPEGRAETETVRALDRALFDASRQGSMVVLGQTRADTLIALRNWLGVPGNALAPISTVLLDGG